MSREPTIASVAPVIAKIGSTSNSYQILAKLAAGGMAEIFLVRASTATGVERYCVLKRVLPERADHARFAQMFLDEARLATQLQHPNIASAYDIGMLDDSYFYTMEYVHGETIQSLIQRAHELRRVLPLACVLTILAGAAAGLHHAHERNAPDGRSLGIVHRDVSPSNVMVSYEGHVKLVDFGVAMASDRTVETHTGVVKGKIGYLSPEQCRCERLDRRSDLFSLGIMAWEMLAGERLYRRASDFEAMLAVVEEIPPRPSSRRSDIPQAVDDLVLRLLTKSLAGRFQTAAEVVETIENASILAGTALSTAAVSRMMHDLFGRRVEPWFELNRLAADAVTLVSRPLPEEFVDAEDPRREGGVAISAPAGTASIEVSASVVGLLAAVPAAEPHASSPSSGFDDTSTEVAALPAAEAPVSAAATSEASGELLPDTAPWAPLTSDISGSRLPSNPMRVASAVPWLGGQRVAEASTRSRRYFSARLARTLVAATLVVATLAAVALSLEPEPAAALDREVAIVAPRAPAIPDALAASIPVQPLATSRPSSAAHPDGEPAVRTEPAASGTGAHAEGPGDAIDRAAGGEPRKTATEIHPESAAPRTAPAPIAKRSPGGDVAPRAPGRGRRPSPVRAAASFESVRGDFEAEDYAGVVAACRSLVVTSAIADLCTRAACRTHDAANAQLWLPVNPAGQTERLVRYCSDLGVRAGRAPALDCSKDPLDCR